MLFNGPPKSERHQSQEVRYLMSANTFTLDDIRAAAEKKYGSVDISIAEGQTVRLVNALRMSKERRDQVTAMQTELESDDVDHEGILREILVLVAEDEEQGRALVEALGDDLGMLMSVFEYYNGETQVGEA